MAETTVLSKKLTKTIVRCVLAEKRIEFKFSARNIRQIHELPSNLLGLPAPHKSQIGGANVPINNAISRGFQNCINRFSTSTRSGAYPRQVIFGLTLLFI